MRRLSLLRFVVLIGGTFVMGTATAAGKQSVHAVSRPVTKTIGYKYLLSLPTDYTQRGERRWPLLLFLHGSGERGDDVWSVADHGPPKLLQSNKPSAARQLLADEFIVVSPQCRKAEWWHADEVLGLLDEVQSLHRVDPGRVYLVGLSMGGFATWDIGLLHPDRFAAIVAVCGGGSLGPIYESNETRRQDLRSLGVWAFHGAKDPSVPVIESQRMVDALKQAKVRDVRLTVYPDADHDSWTQTFTNPDLYRWLLRHERVRAAAKP